VTSEKFSLERVPEVFFTQAAWSRDIRTLTRAGELRKLGPRLYTKNLRDEPAEIVRRNLWLTVGGYFAGAVISDRTAIELRPAEGDNVFLTHPGSDYRTVELPGLVIRARPGIGPLPGDSAYVGGLHISSEARAFLENLRPSRSRSGPARVLPRDRLESRLAEIANRRGIEALNELRDAARAIAPQLDAAGEAEELDRIIGGLFGTGPNDPTTREGAALRAGSPFDSSRVELWDLLVAGIREFVAETRPSPAPWVHFSFYEAYFSNFIEGTEFLVEEAKAIIFEGQIPTSRPRDAHDIIGTFQLVSDPTKQSRVPSDADDLVRILREDHFTMLSSREDANPGQFKDDPNQAGGVVFVAPDLIEGTLREGCERLGVLAPGFERAVFQLFLISEVHPFTDGNGRIARTRMNAELTAAGEQRVMITTAHRDDYSKALRALTLHRNPVPLVRFVDQVQGFSSGADWSSDESAAASLNEINAFSGEPAVDHGGLIDSLPQS